MIDEKYYMALVSVLSFSLSVLICSCVLITKKPLEQGEVAEPSSTVTPTQLPLIDTTATPATTKSLDEWLFYENRRADFHLYHPVQWSPEEASDLDRIYLGEQIIIKYGEADRYWMDCGGDCPFVQTETNVVLSGLPARKLTGYIGSVGGYVPQEYITYIIEYRGGYLIFTLYALGLEVETDQLDSIWPINPDDVKVFEQIIATLEIEESPEPPVEPTAHGSSFWNVVEEPSLWRAVCGTVLLVGRISKNFPARERLPDMELLRRIPTLIREEQGCILGYWGYEDLHGFYRQRGSWFIRDRTGCKPARFYNTDTRIKFRRKVNFYSTTDH